MEGNSTEITARLTSLLLGKSRVLEVSSFLPNEDIPVPLKIGSSRFPKNTGASFRFPRNNGTSFFPINSGFAFLPNTTDEDIFLP